MSISLNGQSKVPPGFRFHPTEEELLQYYLRKKVSHQQIDLDVIKEVDLNKLEPWDIQEMCKIGSMPQNDWYFFSHKDKKYPTGTRTNRASAAGFWKATGRDKGIHSSNCRGGRIGMRKTLVFYKGRAPHGLKSDWIMHEYRLLDDNNSTTSDDDNSVSYCMDETLVQEERWVVCRIFKKKKHIIKTGCPGQFSRTSTNFLRGECQTLATRDFPSAGTRLGELPVEAGFLNPRWLANEEGTLEQIINMGRKTFKAKNDANSIRWLSNMNPSTIIMDSTVTTTTANNDTLPQNKFIKLPNLETTNAVYNSSEIGLRNWSRLDDDPMTLDFDSLDCYDHYDIQLSQLPLSSSSSSSSSLPNYTPHLQTSTLDYFSTQTDLWSFTRSSLPSNGTL